MSLARVCRRCAPAIASCLFAALLWPSASAEAQTHARAVATIAEKPGAPAVIVTLTNHADVLLEAWQIRITYAEGTPVELANEIRLPVGEPVEFELDSPDVIHSFWIPALGGKMDMIPGRRTRLVLHPTRIGTFRGACAEYCGTSHALMAFPVVVMEKADFARWLERQQHPARAPTGATAARGSELFFLNGCSACHAIDGTEARALIGPNLTHVGSRLTLGAGIVQNGRDGLLRWLQQTDKVKPGVHMPHFGMLPRDELDALAAYLDSLQ